MQTPIKLDSFSAVGNGETANLVLANNVQYDQIYLETSLAPNELEFIRLSLNAETIFDLKGTELVMLDQYDDLYSSFGGPSTYRYTLPLSFETALLRDARVVAGALVLGPGDNCVLDVKIASTTTNSPTLKAFAETSGFPGVRDAVRKFERYTIPQASAGRVEFTSMVKGSRLLRAHFASANLDEIEIKRDGRVIYELDKARNDFLLERAKRNPQSGYYHFDPVKTGFPIRDNMSTAASNLAFNLVTSAAGNIEVLVERMDPKPANWGVGAPAKKKRGMGRRR